MSDVQFISHAPQVFVVGKSEPSVGKLVEYLAYRGESWRTDPLEGDGQALIEAAGRVCYCSWRNPAQRSRLDYIQEQIVGHDHLSVAEHVTLNLLCADVPRSTQLETVRHRVGVAYSWESTRFTDKHLRFVIPPRLREDVDAVAMFENACRDAAHYYRRLLEEAERDTDAGTLKRKRAKEAARAVLPNALGSDGLVTMNGRELRYFIARRTDEAADLSMREFAYAIFLAAKQELPALFADAVEKDAELVPQIVFGASE
jgi:thymidylate synthase (FAD)